MKIKWTGYKQYGLAGKMIMWVVLVAVVCFFLIEGIRANALLYSGVLTVLFVMLAAISLRESRLKESYRKENDTVWALGTLYYAIYKVDFSKGTYEMIKGSEYVKQHIPTRGDYELLIKTAGDVMKPDVFGDFRISFSIENMRKIVARRIPNYGGDFLRLFGEEYRWVNVKLLFDQRLEPEEAVLCFQEVDEEKKIQLGQIRLLKESLDATKKSEESKQAFFSNMSHDMRTPLNAIIGLSDLAQKHLEEPDKLKSYLDKIQYSSNQLLELINDILEMSSIENGKFSLNYRHFDLKKCVQDCAEIFQEQAEKEGKHFLSKIEIHSGEVYGDSFRLTQILNNLLSNAVKFSSVGDTITFHVLEEEQGGFTKYIMIVKDTGAGMSEEFLNKIFVPYERETRFGAKNIAGTGLGMPITKNIITQMSGQIYVESKLGEGSTFTVILPFREVSAENKSENREALKENHSLEEDFLKGKQILLAEDNEINMEIACEMLEMYGGNVTRAWDGKEAVEAFQNSEEFFFDVILMDMQMPEMDGCQAARKIRNMDRKDAKSVPIIAVTANAFAQDLAATSAAGMNAHISKPIDFKILVKILSQSVR